MRGSRRLAFVVLAAVAGCAPMPEPERTIVGGREVFVIQEAPCGLEDCAHAFVINRVVYTPTCGSLPEAVRDEAAAGDAVAVADADVASWRLPEPRATSFAGSDPRWLVGVLGSCRPGRWTIAWSEGADPALCRDRPDVADALGLRCA